MTDTRETLDGIDILAPLAPDLRARIARQCAWRTYAADELVVGELDDSRDVFFVVTGRVRAVAYSESGKEVIYRDIVAGSMFGEYSAIDGARRSATVIALEPTSLACLSADRFWPLVLSNPDFAAELLKYLTAQARALTERVFEFSTLAVKNRIHAELLRLALQGQVDGDSAIIAPPPTHADIASRVSTHREAVTRELSSLARDGVIRRERGHIAVPSLDHLSKMVADVLGHGLALSPPGQNARDRSD